MASKWADKPYCVRDISSGRIFAEHFASVDAAAEFETSATGGSKWFERRGDRALIVDRHGPVHEIILRPSFQRDAHRALPL